MPRTTTASTSSIPLSAAPMAAGADHTNHTFPFSAFQRHLSRLATDVVSKLDSTRRTLIGNASGFFRPPPTLSCSTSFHSPPLFASTSHQREEWGKHAFDVALGADYISKTLAGTAVYTVSNLNNEFVLISDPNNSLKSLGLLCFRQEDAQALLAQVQLKQPVLGRGARVVPISLDQVYMLKVEGIAFRFLPDPLQIKNALELKSSNISGGFDGVPIFQSDVLVVRKKNRRYCPLYFQKEDIERELLKVPKQSRGSTQNIMVGSLEDVLKKMEMNDKNSGWDDLIFIPPGKSYSQHLKEVAA